MREMLRAAFIPAQIRQLRRFVPELRARDVKRGPSGVRAQAMRSDGSLVDDFVFESGQGEMRGLLMHVRNAPSPAATSSLSIAKAVTSEAEGQFAVLAAN